MKHAILATVMVCLLGFATAIAQNPGGQAGDRAEDPVCKMMVKKDPELSVRYGNTTYYFCMKKDMEAFQKDPEKYLRANSHPHPDPRR